MNLQQLTMAQARELLKLVTEKEGLLNQLDRIESQILKIVDHQAESRLSRSQPAPRQGKGRRGRKGTLGEAILKELADAGPSGLTILDLTQRLGGPRQRVDSWFYMNAKKHKNLKKVEKGRWQFVG